MKTCPRCLQELPYSSFAKNNSKPDKCQSLCKECRVLYTKEHYIKNKQKYISKARNYEQKLKDYVYLIKKSAVCADCKYSYHPCQLDFDHLKDKEFEISLGFKSGLNKLKKEIAKCEIVCANCHRLRTYNRRGIV